MEKGLRFATPAAQKLRQAIREAGGVEVFAIGDMDGDTVVSLVVTCRGTEDAVPALLDRPRSGQVVVHNHPSGNLEPSHADFGLAALYGDNGVGVVIVDSDVTRSNWVVEPHAEKNVAVTHDAVRDFFERALPGVLPDREARPQQIDMAMQVADRLSHGGALAVEAGTGTGKSLAYLVPAALWALANDAKVVVSTFTKALQAQLLASDLPLLSRAGLPVKTAVLLGRNNYLCKRRLGLALEEEPEDGTDRSTLVALRDWERGSADGTRGDVAFEVEAATWERVESDTELTLRNRCPYYEHCHYYVARRRAAAAHVVVVNHALLVQDLAIRDQGGPGLLPKYRRVILDEAHHLEDAATGAISRRVTPLAIRRALSPMLPRGTRPGALHALRAAVAATNGVPTDVSGALVDRVNAAEELASGLRGRGDALLDEVGERLLPEDGTPVRLTDAVRADPAFLQTATAITELAQALEETHAALAGIEDLLEDVHLDPKHAQPLLDLARGGRRLATHAASLRAALEPSPDAASWVERVRTRQGPKSAGVALAPIDVAPTLRRILWEPLPGAVATSATLAVAGRMDPWKVQVGLQDGEAAIFPSPFDHAKQALLALPRDVPLPEEPDFLHVTAQHIVEAVRLSGGGTFVLCTSYQAVETYANALVDALGPTWPVLRQRAAGRTDLVDRFRDDPRSVLVGTDTFWEGVSVKGQALRQVIVPRLPFRVPTEPLLEAKFEKIAQQGRDPFRALALPHAVLRLRQGYGRLIRSHSDYGIVLLLDRRIHERTYGPVLLRSLPPARVLQGPWRRVADGMRAFWAEKSKA